jgi:hypothetical protein
MFKGFTPMYVVAVQKGAVWRGALRCFVGKARERMACHGQRFQKYLKIEHETCLCFADYTSEPLVSPFAFLSPAILPVARITRP